MAIRSQGNEGAVAAAVAASPMAGSAMPPATALDGKTGTSQRYAREDHTHAARIQRTVLTTIADGTILWTYARPIVCDAGKVPPVTYMVEDGGSVVAVQILSRTFTSDPVTGKDTHVGVLVKAQRSQPLPGLTGILLIAPLITALANFNPFGSPAVSGVKVNLFAADPTQ